MRLVSKVSVGKREVYDLSVKDKEQYIFKNGIVSHNTGIMYSASTVLYITKAQEKDGKNLSGFKFTLKTEKSRSVKEGSKFPLTVLFDKGISRYVGLMEIALATGFCVKPKNGWYARVIDGVQEDRNWRLKDTDCAEYWEEILSNPKFDQACQKLYQLGKGSAEFNEDAIEHLDDDYYEDDE